MRRFWPALLLGALTLPACVPDPPESDALAQAAGTTTTTERPDGSVGAARASTVRIETNSCFGAGVGTGFIIDADTIVTNAHVVHSADQIRVLTPDGEPIQVANARELRATDLAILDIQPGQDAPTTTLDDADPAAGEDVNVFGYAEGGPLAETTGEVTEVFRDPALGSFGQLLRLSAEVRPGNSGGPVVGEDGHVVGVVYAIEIATGDGLAMGISTLRRILDTEVYAPVAPCPAP